MDVLYEILELLKYTVPAVVVLLATLFISKNFLSTQLRKLALKNRQNTQKAVTPARLQAYERVALLLERISPENLVMRVFKPTLTVSSFHKELLNTVREEFEHNLTQQIYVSKGVWEAVKKSKEETVKIINIAASKAKQDAPAMEMSKAVLDVAMELDKVPTQVALDFLKQEVKTMF